MSGSLVLSCKAASIYTYVHACLTRQFMVLHSHFVGSQEISESLMWFRYYVYVINCLPGAVCTEEENIYCMD